MKAILISAAMLVPLAAFANDETYRTEKKAETKDTGRKPLGDKTVDKSQDVKLTQTQALDKLHKVAVGHTEMGNLAQTHARSDKLKSFGQKMAKDFASLDQDVIGYAKDHDIVLSDATGMFEKRGETAAKAAIEKAEKVGKKVEEKAENKSGEYLDETHASKMGRLDRLQGEEFDRSFLTSTIEGCQRFIPVLEGLRGKYDDKKFDNVIGKAIDSLKKYEGDAEKLQKDYQPAT